MQQGYGVMVKNLFSGKEPMVHAAIGISGETGELLDMVKKAWIYGKDFDRENAVEELGDIEFYLEAFRQATGITRNEVLVANINKLSKRYPTGTFRQEDAIARADKQ